MTHKFKQRPSLSRLLGTVAALGVTAAGLALGAGAGVASAAQTENVNLSPGFDRTLPVPGTAGATVYRPVSLGFFDTTADTLRDVRVTVDASTLHGIGELNLPAGCSYTSDDHLHESCALGDARYGSGEFSVGVRALAAAKAGQSGHVAFHWSSANGTPDPASQPATVNVAVGDGPDLAVNDLGRSYKVTPGGTTALPLQLTNLGSRDGKGVEVFVHDQYGHAEVLGNHSNCLYEHYENGQRGAFCTFPDTVIKPGETLQLSDPFTLSTPAGAHTDEIQYGAGLSGDDWVGTPQGTRGTGAPLTLVPAATPKSGSYAFDPTKDIDAYNNLYYTQLDTGTVTDVAGVDGSVDAVIGQDTPVTFTVRNSGTTTLDDNKDLGGSVGVYVDFPATVQVLKTPAGCRMEHGGPSGLSAYPLAKEPVLYSCMRTVALKPGDTTGFTFHVKALKQVSGQYAGLVAVGAEDPTADELNNSAHMVIDAKAATTPSASATASPNGNAPSANGTQDGTQLAATGSGSSTLWTAAGGAAVLAAGAATLVTVRRRSAARRG